MAPPPRAGHTTPPPRAPGIGAAMSILLVKRLRLGHVTCLASCHAAERVDMPQLNRDPLAARSRGPLQQHTPPPGAAQGRRAPPDTQAGAPGRARPRPRRARADPARPLAVSASVSGHRPGRAWAFAELPACAQPPGIRHLSKSSRERCAKEQRLASLGWAHGAQPGNGCRIQGHLSRTPRSCWPGRRGPGPGARSLTEL